MANMTGEEITRLAEWLHHMQGTFTNLMGDTVVQEHVSFLKRSEDWVRSKIMEDCD